jgi:Glyoxalase-like domain
VNSAIDHLVVVATDLEAGARSIGDALGVELRPGGAHPRMGTHNRLLRLGPKLYLEVIAVDPSASAPERPRWFGLDDLAADAKPRLAAWAARTTDIASHAAACGSLVGGVEPMSRGASSWLITIPSDGSLPLGGAAPTVIQWLSQPHPAERLPDSGCSLIELQIFHARPSSVTSMLAAIDFDGDSRITLHETTDAPYLVAHIDTPSGRRSLIGR